MYWHVIQLRQGERDHCRLSHVARPRIHDDALRVRLLDRAGVLLSSEGPTAVSLRRLANEVNTSTTAVYSLFGGKAGLISALYREALDRFARHVSIVPLTDDPGEDMVQMGLIYRRAARSDPHLYSVIFGRPIPEFQPSEEDTRFQTAMIRPLVETARRGVDRGLFPSGTADRIAHSCWALAHGLVSIELSGRDYGPEEPGVDSGRETDYEQALRALVRGWRDTGSTEQADHGPITTLSDGHHSGPY